MSFTIWGVTDGSAGMASQVRGVGELLARRTNGKFIIKQARRVPPFCWLPGWFYFYALKSLDKTSDILSPPYPDILISSGRRSVAIALAIKCASAGKTKLVHLQSPRIRADYFDLVVAMQHDNLHGDNVISTFAALHHLTNEKLAAAAADYANEIMQTSQPRLLICIGGSTHAYKFSYQRCKTMLAQINAVIQKYHGGLWVSTSRRTGAENIAEITAHFKNQQVYTGGERNPYLAWLSACDSIAVTDDSVSMMSEALFLGKPLYIIRMPEHKNTKPAAFADDLLARGLASEFVSPLSPASARYVDERNFVVSEIIKRIHVP